MKKLLTEQQEHVWTITFNNTAKHNAFDDEMLAELDEAIDQALNQTDIHVIMIQAKGRHFSAGADLGWMQRMVNMDEQDNRADALKFAKTLHKLYQSPKPTLALAQGATYGGGIGILATCDHVFVSEQAKFCFSEVSLGLIPAVISPYIVQAIGGRIANALFLSADVFYASQALDMHLVHRIVPEADLSSQGLAHAKKLASMPIQALQQAKALVRYVQTKPIDSELINYTADKIAQIRVSKEAQDALHLFLNR